MRLAFHHDHRNTLLWATKLCGQDLTMRRCYHFIKVSMDHLNSFPSDSIAQLRELSRAFVVPAGGDGLQDEAHHGERETICPFEDFLSRKPVTVGGKVAFSVWLIEPLLAEQTRFGTSEPGIY